MQKLDKLPFDVAAMVNKLRTKGLTAQEKKILPARLKNLWIKSSKSKKSQSRNKLARAISSDIQNESKHLYFVLILLLPATKLGNGKTYAHIEPLMSSKDYDKYKFSLRSDDKDFLDKMAEEEGFGEIPSFIALMQALFPKDQSPAAERRITYAYSNMPRENLNYFLQTIADAIPESNLYKTETERGDRETNAATVLIPEGDADCTVTITIARGSMIKALMPLDLKKIWEQSLDDRGLVFDA